jgi:hypothetical protein
MNSQSRNQLITAAVIVGILLLVGGGVAVYFAIRYSQVGEFNKRINEYTTTFPPAQTIVDPGSQGGYIVGKVITVDMKNKPEVDWVYFDLPDDLKAKKPDDVGTVVQLKWRTETIDHYKDGADANVHIVDIAVVDLAKKQTVGVASLRGTEPPMEKSGSGAAYGSKPTKEIVNFLKSLPKR